MNTLELLPGDALVVVDVQNDFVTGSLAVRGASEVIEPLNDWIAAFEARGLPVVFTRDWHPADHCSFAERGGSWPAHCVAGTPGADFAPGLSIPEGSLEVSKATRAARDAYSGFEGTELETALKRLGVKRLFVGGLATDYCVLRTVEDALRHGYRTFVLVDAIRAVDAKPGDGEHALRAMLHAGARSVTLGQLAVPAEAHG